MNFKISAETQAIIDTYKVKRVESIFDGTEKDPAIISARVAAFAFFVMTTLSYLVVMVVKPV